MYSVKLVLISVNQLLRKDLSKHLLEVCLFGSGQQSPEQSSIDPPCVVALLVIVSTHRAPSERSVRFQTYVNKEYASTAIPLYMNCREHVPLLDDSL